MSIEFFLEKAVEYYPVVAGYAIVITAVIYITVKAHTFYMRTQHTNDNFPRMEALLHRIEKMVYRISNGLDALNKALLEKKVINQSYYTHEDVG